MRPLILAAAALAAASPVPALAEHEPAERLSEKLSDPVLQDRLAASVAVMGEVLLDLPLAPILEAAAEVAGEDPRDVPPDTTLRHFAGPGAERLPEEVSRELPRMMGTMASMAGGMEAMVPALREIADRMRDAMAEAGLDGG